MCPCPALYCNNEYHDVAVCNCSGTNRDRIVCHFRTKCRHSPLKIAFLVLQFGKSLLFPAGICNKHCFQDGVYEPRRFAISLLTLRYFPLLSQLSVSDVKKTASRAEIRAAFLGITFAFHVLKQAFVFNLQFLRLNNNDKL